MSVELQACCVVDVIDADTPAPDTEGPDVGEILVI
jgi:hypothetical protein